MGSGPSKDPSVFHEPHLRPQQESVQRCWKCGYPRATLGEAACPECGAPIWKPADNDDARAAASVFDEPAYSAELTGADAKASGQTYGVWWRKRASETTALQSWVVTLGIALLAGPAAVLGVFITATPGQASLTAVGVMGVVIWAPVVEEVLKTVLIATALEVRPYLFRTRGQILACAFAGGLAFAAIENALYLLVYIDQPSPMIVWWRWTVCVALHTGCSLLAGLGLAKAWSDGLSRGVRPNLSGATRMLIAAIVTHGVYNAFALLLDQTGWLR